MQQRRLDESGIRRAEARTFPTGQNLGQPLLLLQLELLAALLVLEALQPLALGVVLHARLHLLQLELQEKQRLANEQRKWSQQGGEFRKAQSEKFHAHQAKRVEDAQKQKELTSAAVEAQRLRNLEAANESIGALQAQRSFRACIVAATLRR